MRKGKLYVECPLCGEQELLEIGGVIARFDTRLHDPNYQKGLKGGYHTWTCQECEGKFILSNVICDCSNQGVIIKSEKPKPRFICSKCRKEVKNGNLG